MLASAWLPMARAAMLLMTVTVPSTSASVRAMPPMVAELPLPAVGAGIRRSGGRDRRAERRCGPLREAQNRVVTDRHAETVEESFRRRGAEDRPGFRGRTCHDRL